MDKIISKVEIIIEGVSIPRSFKIDDIVHREYVRNVECTSYGKENISITAEIESNNKNRNYLIYLDLKEYLLRLFVLFSVNVRIDESKTTIDTDNDYIKMEHMISPPIMAIDSKDVLRYTEYIRDSLLNRERNGEFYNLIESNQNVDMSHRFRSLFAAFDNIVPKYSNGLSINYHKVKRKYVDIIKLLYVGPMVTRYHEIIKELAKAELIDFNTNINYSDELEDSYNGIQKGTIINEDVAFNILKCVQSIRNKINHGNFEGLTPKMVSGSYELLLPLTQELMRGELIGSPDFE